MQHDTLDHTTASIEHLLDHYTVANPYLKVLRQEEFAKLEKLENRLLALRLSGYSFEEISSVLQKCGLFFDTDMIKEFYFHIKEKQLLEHEKRISGYLDPKWKAVSERALIIEQGLRQTLENGSGLILHYQPQINMLTGKVIGAEALVRWIFNDVVVHPDEFISIAEETGLIKQLGIWVLREACLEAKRWESLGLGDDLGIKMGVNLSVKQLTNDLPDLVNEIIVDTNIRTELLGLEVTESLLAGNESLEVLKSLRERGIHLSMDDFGTGYSCFAKLKDLPVDTIKIDRAFVHDVQHNSNSRAVVESIVGLADKLNMATLAEGVESEDQVKLLLDMGCLVCQGYFYSRPLSGSEFVKFAQEQ